MPSTRGNRSIHVFRLYQSMILSTYSVRCRMAAQHPLPALARHRPLRAAVRVPGSDAEHPAPRRPGRAVPPGVLRGAGVLGLAGRAADRAVHPRHRHARPRPPRLPAHAIPSDTSCTCSATPGYWSGLIGEQHVSADPLDVGYDHVVDARQRPRCSDVAPAATALHRRTGRRRPAVLPVGRVLRDAPRVLRAVVGARRARTRGRRRTSSTRRATRRDMASFKASARSLDQGVGTVLNALEEHDLVDDTLVILTTDHGLAFPDAKAHDVRPRHRRDAGRCGARRLRPAGVSTTRS